MLNQTRKPMKIRPINQTLTGLGYPARNGRRYHQGMTLIELTVVILVMLTLIGLLFFGTTAWKRGSDRATCILQIHSVQKGLRGYANLNGFSPGDTATNLKAQVIGFGKFIEVQPICAGTGIYSFGLSSGIDTIPPLGTLYMQCSLAAPESHLPNSYSDW